MKKLDEIARLIDGGRKDADQFARQVNDVLSERATFSRIAHALRQLPSGRRTPGEVAIALGGESRVVEHRAIEPPIPPRVEEERRKAEAERQASLRAAMAAARIAEGERRRLEAAPQVKPGAEQEAVRIAAEQHGKAKPETCASQIQRFCLDRGITTLIHFTRVQNLRSILQQGLLGRSILGELPSEQQPQFNDDLRIDRCPEAVCLCISFPNYQMFYKYSRDNRGDWAVLLLDAAVLWALNCAFCRENAASNAVRFIPLPYRRQIAALKEMFADDYSVHRQALGIPDNYTTHPQAEVLVFDSIPPHYITEVHFYSSQAREAWLSSNPGVCLPWLGDGAEYFRPRRDWAWWKPISYDVDF